jgi:RimJ/RimL family protein N-acetyltransferase
MTMQFATNDGRELSWSKARSRFDDILAHWKRHNCGFFVMEDKESENPIGVVGVRWLATGELELDYVLHHGFWGQDYEEEALFTCLHYAWREIGTEKVVALAHPKNFTRQKILFSLGFLRLPERDGVYDGGYRMFFIRRF